MRSRKTLKPQKLPSMLCLYAGAATRVVCVVCGRANASGGRTAERRPGPRLAVGSRNGSAGRISAWWPARPGWPISVASLVVELIHISSTTLA